MNVCLYDVSQVQMTEIQSLYILSIISKNHCNDLFFLFDIIIHSFKNMFCLVCFFFGNKKSINIHVILKLRFLQIYACFWLKTTVFQGFHK
jgi:hypothetical protein